MLLAVPTSTFQYLPPEANFKFLSLSEPTAPMFLRGAWPRPSSRRHEAEAEVSVLIVSHPDGVCVGHRTPRTEDVALTPWNRLAFRF